MLTEWVVAWYLPPLGPFERTCEQIINDVLEGNPTPGRLADLVRLLDDQPYFERPLQAGRTLMRDLIRAGLLERNGEFIDVTEAGVSFGMKNLKRRIDREKADTLVRRLLERVEAFNASDDEVVRITRVILFGSYLDPSVRTLGDVDVAFEYEYRPVPETHDVWTSWLAAEVERRTGKKVGRVALVRDGHGTKLTLGAVMKVLRVNNDISPHSLTDEAIFAEKPEMKVQLIYNDASAVKSYSPSASSTKSSAGP
jgi:predicted nucleotidyltransferase